MVMSQRDPSLPFFGPQRLKQTRPSPSITQASSSPGLESSSRSFRALLHTNLHRFRLLLFDLGVREVPFRIVVLIFLVALASAFEGDEVVEVGEGGAELVRLGDGGEV
jgi:hypothetical protein